MNELSLYILDIVQNSFKANAKKVKIIINEDYQSKLLTISIIDDGKGILYELLEEVKNPYYTTRKTRKVGLGIPLFLEQCRLNGGDLKIESSPGIGTTIYATMLLDSIDILPLGNLEETLFTLMINDLDVDIEYKHIKNKQVLYISTIAIKEILDGISILDVNVLIWLKDYIYNCYSKLNKEEQ